MAHRAPSPPPEAKQQQEDEAKRFGVPVEVENSIGMKLRFVPPGRFLMGSPENELGREANEGPQHSVTITKPYYMGKHEVTQAQYEIVTGKNPSRFNKANGGGPDHPVDQLTRLEAISFCQKLSEAPEEKKMGRIYRLPTEAEWEYACRAGTQTAYSFGDDPQQAGIYCWTGPGVNESTHPIGRKKSNSWGLYDTHGNVWEWCSDLFDENSDHSCRGGSCYAGDLESGFCRSANRHPVPSGRTQWNIGFRVVCEYRPPQITNSIGMKLARIPAGEYVMGSSAAEVKEALENLAGQEWQRNAIESEAPAHRVRISRSFGMGIHEVTVGQFKTFVDESKYVTAAEKAGGSYRWDSPMKEFIRDPKATWKTPGLVVADDHPVRDVTWNDALAFCSWLSKKESKTYRLPTEAEWE